MVIIDAAVEPDSSILNGMVEARLQLAAIVESSDDAIISKDLRGIITSWNAAATKLFGYQPEEIIGKSVLTLIPTELRFEEPEILRKLTAGERIEHYETRRQRKNGEIVHISLTISPIRDSDGRVVGISKIARDISDRKLAEEALFESERMAAMGRLAASIAHEVNNPLEAILNLAYLIAQNSSLDEEARGYSELLVNEVVRVGEITRQTLSFYRDTSQPIEVDLSVLLASVLDLHSPLLESKSIRLSAKYLASPIVWARPGELRQVFSNFVTNAIDALPSGGNIQVRVHCVSEGTGVCVTIADDGLGIPVGVRERIFEPFFSTKRPGGTGLGLWISQSIIRKYSGAITVRTFTEPAPRTGTVFRICLPSRC
ncbi:MAG TPA: PAS domain S-box protein [Acidobacteriaceae bacterium]|jgi:PAS domain S-box-containing protein